jgi:hypothetical protein
MSTRKAKCVLVFMDKSDSTCPGPQLFIPHVAASRSLLRPLRALPAQRSVILQSLSDGLRIVFVVLESRLAGGVPSGS